MSVNGGTVTPEFEKWAYGKGRGLGFKTVPEEAHFWLSRFIAEVERNALKRCKRMGVEITRPPCDECRRLAFRRIESKFGLGGADE